MYFNLIFYKKYSMKNMVIVTSVNIGLPMGLEGCYANDAGFIGVNNKSDCCHKLYKL